MKGEARKAAIAAYKERKGAAGIYAVRCTATGEAWVGQSPNLDTVQNRVWFTLRVAGNLNRALQKAWDAHGAEHFAFEVVERLKDDDLAYSRDALLKERLVYWRAELGAAVV
ncbi:GIY-YIG nuclease family protein [Bradyrhizobium sp. SYSU BS000235]|uniref:GIY-YIG nuclease family protein n=1 Tax=Bradyrhizobium sp. SYSU BS000235 TaxID=3411332 RepID=UPI003C778B5B